MANSISGPSRLRQLDAEDLPPRAPAFRHTAPIRTDDGALLQYVQNAAPRPVRTPASDRVLYLGVNPDSREAEFTQLQKLRGDTQKLVSTGSVFTHRGVAHDLSGSAGRMAFALSVGFASETASAVAAALKDSVGLAPLVVALAPGQRGEPIGSRLVLSGHSPGDYLFGAAGDRVEFEDLLALAKALPRAAAQLEDIHLSGCYTSVQARAHIDAWREAFPNLKTLWGYEGFAPAAPLEHLKAWEASTRGRQDSLSPAPWLKEQNVACWSVKQGYVDKEFSAEVLAARKLEADRDFDALMAGRPRLASPFAEPGRKHYETYRLLAGRAPLAAGGDDARRADQLLALRHYETHVRGAFAMAYQAELEAGFREAGRPLPDFANLTRAEALAQVEGVTRPARLVELLQGLAAFDPRVVPRDWSLR